MNVQSEVVFEPVAYTLSACRACGGPDQRVVTWRELREARIGEQWNACGGGSLFSHEVRATLVFRDDKQACLLVEDFYSEVGDSRRNDRKAMLIGFVFTD